MQHPLDNFKGSECQAECRRWGELSSPYLGEDVQLAHDVPQCAGQCLGRADGLPGPALHRLLTLASACWEQELHFWLKTMNRKRAPQSQPSAWGNTERTAPAWGTWKPPANLRRQVPNGGKQQCVVLPQPRPSAPSILSGGRDENRIRGPSKGTRGPGRDVQVGR